MTREDHNQIRDWATHRRLVVEGPLSKNTLFFKKLYYPLTTSVTSQSFQQSGAEEACWAHNPEVGGSKPSSTTQNISNDDQARMQW